MAEQLTLPHFLFPGVVSLNDGGNLRLAAFTSGRFTGNGRNHEQGGKVEDPGHPVLDRGTCFYQTGQRVTPV